MDTIINKPNSNTFARLYFCGGKYHAAVMQGHGFDQVFFGGKSFKTERGARNWITRRFGF